LALTGPVLAAFHQHVSPLSGSAEGARSKRCVLDLLGGSLEKPFLWLPLTISSTQSTIVAPLSTFTLIRLWQWQDIISCT
jgi:hypothetical protein